MKYLPFENVTYTTRLSVTEATDRLKRITDFGQASGFSVNEWPGSKDYQGRVDDNGFNLTRLIGYRNSFLPIINGTFVKNGATLDINVKMRLQPFVAVFIVVWLGLAAFMALALGAALFTQPKSSSNDLTFLIPTAMFILGYLLTLGAFKYESLQSKKDFKSIFDADMVEN